MDDRKRLLYDHLGAKGVGADNLAVLPFMNTQELKKEFERLLEEKEKRLLEQRMNPKGTVSVGFNVSELFDMINEVDEDEFEIQIPDCETNQIVINQSIDITLNQTDIATVGANVSVQKGRGVGALNSSIRRILSSKSWIEGQISVGQGLLIILKGFRRFGTKNFANCNLYLIASSGKPGIELGKRTLKFFKTVMHIFNTVFGRSITQEVMGTITLKGGIQNSIEANLAWERDKLRFDCGFQVCVRIIFTQPSTNFCF